MSPQATQARESSAQRQIARAKQLERQRAELMKLISANRDYLRLMDVNGELEGETTTLNGNDVSAGEWLDAFYPQKERGERRDQGEIEATRKAKEEARKSDES